MKYFSRLLLIGLLSIAFFIVVTNYSVYTESQDFVYQESLQAKKVDVALIPGAAVSRDGVLSPIFIDRIDAAVALYESQKVSKILVSGDNSTLAYNEVNPVRLYLIKKGIPDKDIFLDHAGFDTYSTMYRARDIFGVSSMIIATQSFHLPRSLYIAHKLGIEAYGINADRGHILFRNYVREVLATEKAIFDVFIHRKPKFLGDAIPIMGAE